MLVYGIADRAAQFWVSDVDVGHRLAVLAGAEQTREQAVPIGVQSGIEHPIRQNRRRPLPRSGVPIFAVLLIAEDLADTLNQGNAVRCDEHQYFRFLPTQEGISVFAGALCSGCHLPVAMVNSLV